MEQSIREWAREEAKVLLPIGGSFFVALFLKDYDLPAAYWTPNEVTQLRSAFRTQSQKFQSRWEGAKGQQRLDEGYNPQEKKALQQEINTRLRLTLREGNRLFGVLITRLENPASKDGVTRNLMMWQRNFKERDDRDEYFVRSLYNYITDETFDLTNDHHNRELTEAVEDQKIQPTTYSEVPVYEGTPFLRYDKDGHHAEWHWTVALLPKQAINNRDMLKPNEGMNTDSMVALAGKLNDLHSNLIMYFMHRYVQKADFSKADRISIVKVHITEVMEGLGYKRKKNGSFDEQDKRRIREHTQDLQNFELLYRKHPDPKKKNENTVKRSGLFYVLEADGQDDLFEDRTVWNTIEFHMGRAWNAYMQDSQSMQLVSMQLDALRYNTQRERIERRLLIRAGRQWRIELDRGQTEQTRDVRSWLTDQVRGSTEDLKRVDAERLEQAFDRLQSDGHISDWAYEDDGPTIRQTEKLPRGWADIWLERQISITAPHFLIEGMKEHRLKKNKIFKRNTSQPSNTEDYLANASLGEQLKIARMKIGVTQTDLSAALEIDRTHMVRIESGKRKPTDEQEARILEWIAKYS